MILAVLMLALVALVHYVLVRQARNRSIAGGRAVRSSIPTAIPTALTWGSLLFVVSLTSLFSIDALPVPEVTPRGRQRLQQRRAAARLADVETGPSAADLSAADETARELYNRTFPSGWKASGSISQLRREEVMRIRPPEGVSEEAFREGAPYYLRGLVLAEFDESGSQAAIPAALPLFAAEENSDWIELSPKTSAPAIELVIEQVPLIVRRGAWNVLFAPRPLRAVRAPSVLFAEDALLALPAAEGEERTLYSTRSSDLKFTRDCPMDRDSGDAIDPRWTALPAPSPTVDLLKSTAEKWTRGANSDAERVTRIVNHFRSEFAYAAISADVPGLQGIQNFLELERGYCTYFAAGTTLLLRTLDIPARVATGFLAEQWDDEADAFVVTTQNGHAWVEVWFDDLGWLRVEPTPGARRLRALGRLAEGPSGLREWATTFGKDLRFVVGSGARSSDLGVLGDTVMTLPSAFARSVRRRPWSFGIGFLGALAALAWRSRRSRGQSPAAPPKSEAERETLNLEQRFRALLVERGAPNHASATLREQSRAARSGERLAEDLARLRFSADPPSAEELDSLRERVADLVNTVPHTNRRFP